MHTASIHVWFFLICLTASCVRVVEEGDIIILLLFFLFSFVGVSDDISGVSDDIIGVSACATGLASVSGFLSLCFSANQ